MESESFDRFLKLLLKWNQTYNLTAITNENEIQIKHFEDSLAPLPFLPAKCRLLDIGCGAGFPGIPLKIKRPDLEIILLDSQRKRIAFCEAAIRELHLKDISAIHGRAEDKKIQQQLGCFDIVISRATFSLEKFLALTLPFTKKNGTAIAMKGPEEENTVVAGWALFKNFPYELSQGMGKRVLYIFQKN
ncbi:MAG: 16S rRNA (guanine(527)-N(7))-methyltransferase RsmG [Deltaproteobacteria bacterium]|nr:16S rRNA (guanine(527)-N(7))-methyltransferase RsmG [Deltaproteobacteria bacterium]